MMTTKQKLRLCPHQIELIQNLQTNTPSWKNPIYYGNIRVVYAELNEPFENPEILDM